jgi:hypothetical protein
MWYVWGWKRCVYRVLWRNLRERDHLVDRDVDNKIILKLIFKKWDMWV